MELGFKDEDIKFRDEVRDFIKETYTAVSYTHLTLPTKA